MELAEYIGLPFAQFNCAALVTKVAREKFGIEIPLHVSECEDPLDGKEVAAMMAGEILNSWIKLDVGKVQPGDVVLFRMMGLPSHVGLLIGDGLFLHVLPGREACVERLDGVCWRHRVCGYYRYSA